MMERVVSFLSLCALLALSLTVRADGSPVLHEFLPPDSGEDINLSASANSGVLPAAVHTPSGIISPPDIHTTPPPRRTYHKDPESSQSGFQPDRDTRRPSVENYDDPFSPKLTPFKRLHAFDAVHESYRLYVRDERLKPMAIGGAVKDGDDRFFADMMVQLRAGEPVRIPTVGPGARMISLVTYPKVEATLLRDGAENWFLESKSSERVRLVAEIAVERASFASEYADVEWRALPPGAIQPAAHAQAFEQVAREIGISKRMRPREVVTKMIEYFRSFAPSNEPPTEHGDIYLDLALSKRGVCRHRAFAFLVTALHIGIPTRLIHNEAHAWVEVRDDRSWHRIDLGGAAIDLQDEPRFDRPDHVPPPDQFAWPTGRDSGEDLAHRERQQAQQARDATNPGPSSPTNPGPGDPDGPVDPNAPPDPNAPSGPDRPEPKLTIDTIDRDIFRGKPMRLRGQITADGAPCANVRVDVLLHATTMSRERRIGSLSTDERGNYDGQVVLPRDLRVGDYELTVATPGNKRCGSGRAQ
jgi:transglutaminase-like putative cysteine protease